jgi:hypothetical protein
MIPNTFNWDEDNSVLCLSEHQESTDSFFSDKNIATQLYSIRSIIKTLHLNDRKLYSGFDFELKIQLSALSRHIKYHGQAMEVIFKLVDFLANEHKFTVSQKAQVKIQEHRKMRMNELSAEERKKMAAKNAKAKTK